MRWSKKEESFLIFNYGVINTPSIAKKLDRTVLAVKTKAKRLGLSIYDDERYTVAQVSDILDLDPTTIYKYIKAGLLKKKLLTVAKTSITFIAIDSLVDFMKNNPQKWSALKVRNQYVLGIVSEFDWFKEKFLIEQTSSLKVGCWSLGEIQKLETYIQKGYSTLKIASLLNRSEPSIQHKRWQVAKHIGLLRVVAWSDDVKEYIDKYRLSKTVEEIAIATEKPVESIKRYLRKEYDMYAYDKLGYTSKDISRICGVNPNQIQRWVKNGLNAEIHSFGEKKIIYSFDINDVCSFLRKRQHKYSPNTSTFQRTSKMLSKLHCFIQDNQCMIEAIV